MIKQLYQRFISLKSMWWTHVLVWGTNISLFIYIIYVLLGILTGNSSNRLNQDFAIGVYMLSLLYMIANYYLSFIIASVFIIEVVTLFHFKITNKFILTNPTYHIFWIIGFVSFLFSSCVTIFYLKIF